MVVNRNKNSETAHTHDNSDKAKRENANNTDSLSAAKFEVWQQEEWKDEYYEACREVEEVGCDEDSFVFP